MIQQSIEPMAVPGQYVYYVPAQQNIYSPQVIQEIIGILMIILVAVQAFSQMKGIFTTQVKGSK